MKPFSPFCQKNIYINFFSFHSIRLSRVEEHVEQCRYPGQQDQLGRKETGQCRRSLEEAVQMLPFVFFSSLSQMENSVMEMDGWRDLKEVRGEERTEATEIQTNKTSLSRDIQQRHISLCTATYTSTLSLYFSLLHHLAVLLSSCLLHISCYTSGTT